MKSHFKIKLKKNIVPVEAPFWEDVITQKSRALTTLHPQIDAILTQHQLPVWITREYQPARRHWDPIEIATGLNRIYRLILQQTIPIPPLLIEKLSHLPIVEYVQSAKIGQSDLPVARPMQINEMTDLRSRSAIYIPQAHQLYTTGDPQITVAVLDTGVDLSHPELQACLLPGYDFVNIIDGATQFIGDYLGYDDIPDDEVGHGTHVAGIIAAQGLNMPVGVVPRCKILPVRVLGAMQQGQKRVGAGLIDNINTGIKWAVDQGAAVINMSLGVQHTGGGLPHAEVVEYAYQKGVSLVAASGNDGREALYYPGALPYVITVGAVDEKDSIASFSTYGQHVDIVAPGTDIYSAYIGDTYAFSTGTSHAAPFVAGIIAMLKAYAFQKKGLPLTDRQIKYLLKQTADRLDSQLKHFKAGFGKINALDALRLLDYKLK